MNVLVIAAHPDDEVLGVGGTIINHVKKGDKVYLCILSEGATARYEKDMIEVLRLKTKQACKFLGIEDVTFYDFGNIRMNAVPMLDIVKAIESCIETYRPNIIYTHHKGDCNYDHIITHFATLAAIRLPERGRKQFENKMIKKVYCYEVPSSTEWGDSTEPFTPNVYADIETSIEKKIEAVRIYDSESKKYPHPRSEEIVRSKAMVRGSECGIRFAETFMLLREII